MGLILSLGSAVQTLSMSWGLLATELALILLPTLLFIRLGRLDARAVLRLRWPGWPLVLLGVVIGAGTWGLDIGLQGLASTVLGYPPPTGQVNLPTDPLNLTVFALAMAVAAPVCEEVLFRGYLLSAYGRYRPLVRVLAVALLFAFFHLQFQGLFALLPIALVITLLAERSNSIAVPMAAHLGNNSLGAVLAITMRLNPTLASQPALTSVLCGAMVVGPLMALAGLWVFLRRTRPVAAAVAEAPALVPAPPLGRGAFWPLAGAAAVYVVVAGLEVTLGRFPQVLADRSLALEPAPWTEPAHLAYDLWNVANEQVGEAECTLTPEGEAVAFDCFTRQRSFEARIGQSLYAGGRYELTQTGRWDAATMRLLEADLRFDGEYGGWTAHIGPAASAGGELSLWLGDGPATPLPADTVLTAEWPWRLMALPFERTGFLGSHLNHTRLGTGEPEGQVEAGVVLVRGQEDLPTPPSGNALAWKVMLGQKTAWYAAQAPHTLLRYNDGFGVTWTVRLDGLDDGGD